MINFSQIQHMPDMEAERLREKNKQKEEQLGAAVQAIGDFKPEDKSELGELQEEGVLNNVETVNKIQANTAPTVDTQRARALFQQPNTKRQAAMMLA